MVPGTPYERHKGYQVLLYTLVYSHNGISVHTYCTGEPLVSLHTLDSRPYILYELVTALSRLFSKIFLGSKMDPFCTFRL